MAMGTKTDLDNVTATGRCTITIDSTVPEETASWYDVWVAAVSADGMCARQGRAGLARFIGEYLMLLGFGEHSRILVADTE